MPSNQENPIESPTPILGLLYLMRDLEVLGAELQVADEAIGRPNWAHQSCDGPANSCWNWHSKG